jgi:hypothetical protein
LTLPEVAEKIIKNITCAKTLCGLLKLYIIYKEENLSISCECDYLIKKIKIQASSLRSIERANEPFPILFDNIYIPYCDIYNKPKRLFHCLLSYKLKDMRDLEAFKQLSSKIYF